MSIVEHIQELRRRLIISLLALAVGTIAGFIWYQHSFFGIPSLGEILRAPYCSVDPSRRVDLGSSGECRLLATGPFEMFMLRLKVGALVGSVLASPVWLAQIWGFITPGLLKNERRWTASFVSIAVILFVSGAVLAYFVLSYGLEFLLGIGDEAQEVLLSGQLYFNFMLSLLLIFGVSFEVPLVIAVLNIAGVLTYDQVKDKRRYIIVGLAIFAAFMTPGQDPISMVILTLALTALVELALQFCRWHDKRRKRERPDWLDTGDEESTAIAAPAPVTPAASLRTADYDDIL
ncbi:MULTISPECIES: twin-arginine translocase subunit TatC [unclassified Corynebacterium]|uniref:twin-arginine translocase subunit TatC n=1 Tax=unclassified Corynebacterium TaxID=2624378 RepID=UPI0029C9D517|nr:MULTISPECIES: twin-arginine translocase subunit TatC [unclassified Corynebacterium]WPF67268.1 twin-arginine translocase subunit TatC [Corynebacterium sp. 22KM0430]WPF69757.1 twin-arginine translocase subunit TatC [Corynebacterium sp. 21KM1197]